MGGCSVATDAELEPSDLDSGAHRDDGVGGPRYWGVALASLGVTLAAAGLTFWFAWGFPGTTATNQAVLGIVVHVLFGYVVVMSGITIYRSELGVDECLVAVKWCLGGFLFMSGLVVWEAAAELLAGEPTMAFFNRLVVVGSVGAAAGVLVGLNRGQAVQNERLVDAGAERRETLVFLLRLLRHDLRNDLTEIAGRVDGLRDELEEASALEHVERIDERTTSTCRLLETAGDVVESETGLGDRAVVDVSSILRDRASDVATDDGVGVRTDLADGARIRADGLVDELFRNVLENAVRHNPEPLTVSVSSAVADGDVEVTIADDGEGIPASIRSSVFEPGVRRASSPGDGLGLYLVRKLVDAYDGSIAVEDVEPTGTRFRLRFPLADRRVGVRVD